jgi:XTP/dITP diphosphohydrolase
MLHEKDPTPLICQGSWEGFIMKRPQGDNGFGYDPLFYVPEHNCSAAQLPTETKTRISHRGRAMTTLIKTFEKTYRQP